MSQLGRWRAGPCWLLLLSDAQAHDIDIHDPLYLAADARHAARSASRRGLRLACLALGSATLSGVAPDEAAVRLTAATRIFGRRAVQPLPSAEALPRALWRLLA